MIIIIMSMVRSSVADKSFSLVYMSKLVLVYWAVRIYSGFVVFFFVSHVSPGSPLHKMPRKQEAVPVWNMEEEGRVSVLLICI